MQIETFPRLDVTGYVLAGGRSTRMGRNKALLPLGGEPLALHAVRKLRHLAGEVRILGSQEGLAVFAPLVPDLQQGRGPLGGMEAALEDMRTDWALMMPVDMPFVPLALLARWVSRVVGQKAARVAFFSVDGRVQPALCMLHREIGPYVARAIEQERLKLYPALEEAACALASLQGNLCGDVLLHQDWNEGEAAAFLRELEASGAAGRITPAQRAVARLWFANLNTPQEFAEAERHTDALDA